MPADTPRRINDDVVSGMPGSRLRSRDITANLIYLSSWRNIGTARVICSGGCMCDATVINGHATVRIATNLSSCSKCSRLIDTFAAYNANFSCPFCASSHVSHVPWRVQGISPCAARLQDGAPGKPGTMQHHRADAHGDILQRPPVQGHGPDDVHAPAVPPRPGCPPWRRQLSVMGLFKPA
eukprot:366119-Chlamydomonas_euryale.AAC.26